VNKNGTDIFLSARKMLRTKVY